MSEYDVSGWDMELQALAAEYSPETVITAFRVKNHIDNQGYKGIDFSGDIATYLRRTSRRQYQSQVAKHMRRELRKKLAHG